MCKRSNYPKYLQKRGREHPAIERSTRSAVVTGKHCPRLLPTQAHLHSGPRGRVCSDSGFLCQTPAASPHPSPSEAPAGRPLPHSCSRPFPATSLPTSLKALYQTSSWPLPLITIPHQRLRQRLLLPCPCPSESLAGTPGEAAQGMGEHFFFFFFWTYSCRADPDAAGSQEAIGERLILESRRGSV